jgi:hypothetical protein
MLAFFGILMRSALDDAIYAPIKQNWSMIGLNRSVFPYFVLEGLFVWQAY